VRKLWVFCSEPLGELHKGMAMMWQGMSWMRRLLFVIGVTSPSAFMVWVFWWLPQHNINLFMNVLVLMLIVGTALGIAIVMALLGGFDDKQAATKK
jgi:hypothetical protein